MPAVFRRSVISRCRSTRRADLAALTLLDLSAAFDTVDQRTLIYRLETSYGIPFALLFARLVLDMSRTTNATCRVQRF